jgi:1,2-diacylglycerol 3-beta-galactosyltransferase
MTLLSLFLLCPSLFLMVVNLESVACKFGLPGLPSFHRPHPGVDQYPSSLKDIDFTAPNYKAPPVRQFLYNLAERLRCSVGQPVNRRLVQSRGNEVSSHMTSSASVSSTQESWFSRRFSSTKKKILILMSDTGGGHRASAQALDQALQEQYPGRIDVKIMDIWTEQGKWPFNKLVPMYRFAAKNPIIWRGFYSYGLFSPTRMVTELDSLRCYNGFKKAIVAADPDFVVSVHPLCQMMPISIIKEMNKNRPANRRRIPFVTVVTDLGSAHSTWFDHRADAVFVPSVAVRDIALRNRIPPERILMKGLPIRPPFWKSCLPKRSVRRALGLDLQSKTVLLMGGGDGVGGLGDIAQEMVNKMQALTFPSQLVVICGHNRKMLDALSQKFQMFTVPSIKPSLGGFARWNHEASSLRTAGLSSQQKVGWMRHLDELLRKVVALPHSKPTPNKNHCILKIIPTSDLSSTNSSLGSLRNQGCMLPRKQVPRLLGPPNACALDAAASKTATQATSTSTATATAAQDQSTPKVRVEVRGFVGNIDQYMAASDLLVSKAGPGTIAEAMVRALPVLLSSYLPGQVYYFKTFPLIFILFTLYYTMFYFGTLGVRQRSLCCGWWIRRLCGKQSRSNRTESERSPNQQRYSCNYEQESSSFESPRIY